MTGRQSINFRRRCEAEPRGQIHQFGERVGLGRTRTMPNQALRFVVIVCLNRLCNVQAQVAEFEA